MDSQTLRRIRSSFPILNTRVDGKPLIYFDNGATTQKPREVIDAITQFYRKENANVHRAAHHLSSLATAHFEQARGQLAQFINAKPNEIVWTRGATEGLNLVAESYLRPILKAGDRIVIAISAHHAAILPFQRLAQQVGAHLDVIELTASGELNSDQYQSYLKLNPKLVVLPHASNVLGTVYPIKEMVKLAKREGLTTLIDGAQAAPHLVLDMQDLDADFYAFSGHKMFGPTGIGVLYGKEALLNAMPPWQVGGEMIESVSLTETQYAEAPLRFEAGTPDIAGAIGLAAAAEYLNNLDRAEIEEHEQQLTSHLLQGLKSIEGIKILPAGEFSLPIVSFYHETINADDIAAQLDAQGIAVRAGSHCAQPLMQSFGLHSSVRISLAFYNTIEELDTCIALLRSLCSHQPVTSDETSNSDSAKLWIEQVEQAKDWPTRLNALMSLGSVSIDPSLKRPENLVTGCASQTWIKLSSEKGFIQFDGCSESRQITALIQLFKHQIDQGSTVEQIKTYLTDLGLERQLSRTRGNAIQRLIEWLESHDS
ncbi:putative cysteine desulfurase [Marinobacterium sp. xm-g-59]|uniref:SufS family cysteine desulfurase n=1 Tax=Marinobacterium sp. xm-g-59 TaxID=2497748 RepID=UPI001569A0CD|nr:SufS family cysteine desulfurase [Marinobacterium sp. xm-g-59]NRP96072.1 putative cysteine desulfurase [Marinobacterium sp. xm-g-59]